MKKNKGMNQVDGTGQEEGQEKKLAYEKPTMKALALFADQVLGSCGKLPSDPVPECTLAGMFS